MNNHTKPRKTPMLPEHKPPDARLIGAALAAALVLVAVAFMLFAEQPRPLVRSAPTAAPQPTTTQAQPTEAQPTPKPTIEPTQVWPTITPFPEMVAPVQAAPAAPAVAQPAIADELPVIVAVPAAPAEAHEPLRIRAEDECNAEHGRCTPPCTAEHGRCTPGDE